MPLLYETTKQEKVTVNICTYVTYGFKDTDTGIRISQSILPASVLRLLRGLRFVQVDLPSRGRRWYDLAHD